MQVAQDAQDRARQQPASQAAARQPGSSPPARQQPASPAAARQPSSSPPAQQQPASPAAARQPSSSPPARQQPASPPAARQPSSRSPARQQPAGQAAARRPGSSPPARQQITGQAAMLYTRLRGRAHPLRAALMFLRACADAREGTARAPAGYAGSEARKLGRFVIFFGISVRAGRKKWGLKLSGKG